MDNPETNDQSRHLATLAHSARRVCLALALALPLTLGMMVGVAQASTKPATAPALGSAASFAVLSAAPNAAGVVACTTSTVKGNVGSSGAAASVVQVGCAITGTVVAPVSAKVLSDFNNAYNSYAAIPCTGSLDPAYTGATLTLTPGVYCSAAAVTLTDTTLTLNGQGNANASWIFKIGTGGTGALTGTNFTIVLAGGAQARNVSWWLAEAATMTDSNFKGTILAGAAITITRGTFTGNALAKATVTLTDTSLVGVAGSTGPIPSPKPTPKPHDDDHHHHHAGPRHC
jgi:Ice-binding-like